MFVLLTLLVMLSCGCAFAQPLQGSVSAVDESMRPGAVYEPVPSRVEFYRIPAAFAGTFQNKHSTYTTGVQDYNGKIYSVIGGDPQVSPGWRETQYTTQLERQTLYMDKQRIVKRSFDIVLHVDNKTHKVKRTLQLLGTSESILQSDGTICTQFSPAEVYSDTGQYIRTQPGYTTVNRRIAPYVRDDRYNSAFADWMQTKGAR